MNLFEEYRYDDISTSYAGGSLEQGSPLFTLKKLDWEKSVNKVNKKSNKPRVILRVASSNNVIVIATNVCSVLRWNLADGSKEPEEIEISAKAEDQIEHIFIDPTGNHVIISLRNLDNYYLNSRSQRPKKISKLQGLIECIAFDRQHATENSTKTFLVGTSNGMIYEMSLDNTGKEKMCNCVYQLEQPIPITSIYFEILSSTSTSGSGGVPSSTASGVGGVGWSATAALSAAGQSAFGVGGGSSAADRDGIEGARIFVMCATSSPTRMYHFIGGPTFSALFAEYVQSGTTSFTELPGEIKRAELYCYGKSAQTRAQNFALMTEMGIYHGSLLFTNTNAASSGSENVLLEAQLLPFVLNAPVKGSKAGLSYEEETPTMRVLQKPVSIAVSEFHFLILRGDRLQVMSRLNGALVQEDALKSSEGVMLGMIRDTTRNATWLYSTTSIFQVISHAEDRHVWSINLHKALTTNDEKLFDVAFEYSKNKDQKNIIMRAQADFYMNSNRPERAAVCFAKSGLSFDEVALKLINCVDANSSGSSSSALVGVGAAGGAATAKGTAAPVVAPSAASLEDMRLLLTGGGELMPLRIYLTEVLKTLPLGAKSQRTMLCTWLCEIYLHQISAAAIAAQSGNTNATPSAASAVATTGKAGAAAGKPNTSAASTAAATAATPSEAELTAQFKDFLRSNKLSLDQSTTFSLIISRNNRSLLLFFAQIVGDYHRVVSIYMTDRRYIEAIQVLRDAPFDKVVNLIYKTSPVLIEIEPEATVNMLLSKPQLSVSGLLPALLRYSSALDLYLVMPPEVAALHTPLNKDFEGNTVNFAIKFLKECLDRLNCGFGEVPTENEYDVLNNNMNYASPEPVLFHTLIWLLAKYDNTEGEQELFNMLSRMRVLQVNNIFNGFDIDFEYILRQCRLFKRQRAAVIGLLLLEATETAVHEALALDLDMAKDIASRQMDRESCKALWLIIAKHVINVEVDMKKPIALIKESNGVLSIDDLLPHLPDFTEIDFFKEEICNSLENCGNKIHALKAEMEELAETAESTVKELESMKNRAYSMTSQNQRCEYCVDPLFGKQFYLFPCSHGFHSQCLLRKAPQHLQPAQWTVVKGIEDALKSLAGRVKDSDNRARAQQEALQLELDGYIAADCPLCGFVMIQSLGQSLISGEDALEAKSWEL